MVHSGTAHAQGGRVVRMAVRRENRYFDVFPKIVRAGDEASITIRPRVADPQWFDPADSRVTLIPMDGLASGEPGARGPVLAQQTTEAGALRVRAAFQREQEFVLLVEHPGAGRGPLEFHLYALEPDLFARRPVKGDLHIHSIRSDGEEPPAYVAAAGRRAGLDFIAVTDHAQYAPSLEAQRAFAGVPIDLAIFPGEEVHPPANPVHIVNFGGRAGLTEQFGGEPYRAEVEALAARLSALPADGYAHAYASCVWCFDRIRALGGLGVFCHPYWVSQRRYDVPVALSDALFKGQPFDALELLGGYRLSEVESNALQIARYGDERARGRRIPIVGVSDAHGCEKGELLGWYYTIVFSPSTALGELIASIKALYSVAVEALPGQAARAYGPLRLVKYAQFLLREVFPQHDELCAEEGRHMLAYLAGDAQAVDRLAGLLGSTQRLFAPLWASDPGAAG